MQAILNKLNDLTSRKLLVTLLFSTGIPCLFKHLGISDTVCLSSLALGASYLAANVLDAHLNS